MKLLKSWKWLFRKKNPVFEGGAFGLKMKQLPFMGVLCIVMLFIVYRTTNYQYQQTEMEGRLSPFDHLKDSRLTFGMLRNLPNGMIERHSDLELKPLWWTHGLKSKADESVNHNLLAISVGIDQKHNVDVIVRKFLPENFTVILFHYDGHVDGWSDLDWNDKALHVVVQNQTKWWFAKRFLHPDVVSMYDYIFLWDEDLGVEHFDPGRYLAIVKAEGLEISQPALDPNSTNIHHRITIRSRAKKFHRRVYDDRGSTKCDDSSEGPPCSGFVEGMAPVFSRSAWYCAWHLIQNDLVHGWGMDMKLGYCAQGDRTKKVGIVDSEYVVHKGIPTLGGDKSSGRKTKASNDDEIIKRHAATVDTRSEIRRQSTWELEMFKQRWNQAVQKDKKWVDPFKRNPYYNNNIQQYQRNTHSIDQRKRRRLRAQQKVKRNS